MCVYGSSCEHYGSPSDEASLDDTVDTRDDGSTSSGGSSSGTEEGYLMVTNRSRRQRKDIKYDCTEFDDLIKSAIKSEDAFTEYKRKLHNKF